MNEGEGGMGTLSGRLNALGRGLHNRYSRTRTPRTIVALLCIMACVLPVNLAAAATSSPTGAAPDMVKVARDMTASSNCKLAINGVAKACPAGMIVGDFAVTRTAALAAGEPFVAPTGDRDADFAALKQLMHNVQEQARRQAQSKSGESMFTANGCGTGQVAYYSYDANNFPSPTNITVEVHYDVTYENGVCNRVSVGWSKTDFGNNTTSNVYFDYSAFYQTGYNPGCPVNLPHYANYPSPMYGHTGDSFDDGVENGCNWWDARTSSSIPLY